MILTILFSVIPTRAPAPDEALTGAQAPENSYSLHYIMCKYMEKKNGTDYGAVWRFKLISQQPSWKDRRL